MSKKFSKPITNFLLALDMILISFPSIALIADILSGELTGNVFLGGEEILNE